MFLSVGAQIKWVPPVMTVCRPDWQRLASSHSTWTFDKLSVHSFQFIVHFEFMIPKMKLTTLCCVKLLFFKFTATPFFCLFFLSILTLKLCIRLHLPIQVWILFNLPLFSGCMLALRAQPSECWHFPIVILTCCCCPFTPHLKLPPLVYSQNHEEKPAA